MSWFFRAGLIGLAVACVFVVAAVDAFARYPYDNGHHYGQLSNPGHHYGQLKHHQSPPPAPVPSPAPGPGHHQAGGGTTVVATVQTNGKSATGAGASKGIPELPVTLPVGGGPSDQVGFTEPSSPGGGLEWLLLLLVPALAALWVISGARTAERASRRRRGQRAQA